MTGEVALRSIPKPQEVEDALLRSLPRSLTSALWEKWVDRSTPERGWDGEFSHYELRRELSREEAEGALPAVRDTLVPAGLDLTVLELTRLRVVTRSREMSFEEAALTLQAYAEELGTYPADAMVDGLRYWGRTEEFWPSLSKLKAELDRRVRKRRALLRVLEEANRA